MNLKEYLSALPVDKRSVLLGNDTDDVLHKGFFSKRVVHAGLIGVPLSRDEQQGEYYESLRKKADLNRRHSVYIHIPFCRTKMPVLWFLSKRQPPGSGR